MIAKTEYTISEDLTAYVEKDEKGTPCMLVVYSERLDDFDTYVPQKGMWKGLSWELSFDSLGQRRDELAPEDAAALEALWDDPNSDFVAWVDSLREGVSALPKA